MWNPQPQIEASREISVDYQLWLTVHVGPIIPMAPSKQWATSDPNFIVLPASSERNLYQCARRPGLWDEHSTYQLWLPTITHVGKLATHLQCSGTTWDPGVVWDDNIVPVHCKDPHTQNTISRDYTYLGLHERWEYESLYVYYVPL